MGERLNEKAIAVIDGEAGPGITAWCAGVRRPCFCGHSESRHGERGGADCGYLGCDCRGYRAALLKETTP
jgi:hypothetical protein